MSTIYHPDGTSSSYNPPTGYRPNPQPPQGYTMQQPQNEVQLLRGSLNRAQLRLSEIEERFKEYKEDSERRTKTLEATSQANARKITDLRNCRDYDESLRDQLIDEIQVLRKDLATQKSSQEQLMSEVAILREDIEAIRNPTVRRSSRLSKKRAQESPANQDQKRSKTT